MFDHRLKTLRNGIGNAIDLAIHSHDAIIVSHEYNKLLAGLFKRAEECDQELQDDQKKRAFSDSNTSLVPCWIKWHVLKACQQSMYLMHFVHISLHYLTFFPSFSHTHTHTHTNTHTDTHTEVSLWH